MLSGIIATIAPMAIRYLISEFFAAVFGWLTNLKREADLKEQGRQSHIEDQRKVLDAREKRAREIHDAARTGDYHSAVDNL